MMEPTPFPRPRPLNEPHSIFGVISFAVGVISLLLACVGLALAFMTIGIGDPFGPLPLGITLSELCPVLGTGLSLLGLGSGIAGFFEAGRRPVFNILGISLNVLSLLILGALLVLALIGTGPSTAPGPNL